MNPIDLVEFAEHSQKLPTSFLSPKEKKSEFTVWKILAGHYLDFGAAFAVTALSAAIFNASLKPFLAPKLGWSDEIILGFSASMLPFMVFSYFFFSYFMNHGQTWGMHVMKKRVDMESKNFKEAALWACYSMVLCFTGGLSYFIKKGKWQSFKAQDYLYDNLMVERTFSPVQLLSEINKFEKEEVDVVEDWSRAA